MADDGPKISSLHEHTIGAISRVLYGEGFPTCVIMPTGIVSLVDAIAAYHEEGIELFPHIIITTNIKTLLQTIPSVQYIQIRSCLIHLDEFVSALKYCAPLAIDGWIIYIEVSAEANTMVYGVVSSEYTETSPTIHRQLLGDLSSGKPGVPFVYISNIGLRSVLIECATDKTIISLSLKQQQEYPSHNITNLAKAIAINANIAAKDSLFYYLQKLLGAALKECHGTLVAVVDDSEKSISVLKEAISDGIYLGKPIDLSALIENSEELKSREASTLVRIYSSTVYGMLNFDGITVFTNTGKVLAYHCFIRQGETNCSAGGARSRAFEALVGSKLFTFCMCKSQDGLERMWCQDDK